MKSTSKTMISLLLAAEMLLGSALWSASPAVAAQSPVVGTPYTADGSYDVTVPHIIINQVYGGGDFTTTAGYFSNGYIELYNPTDSDVNLSGWSVQYSDPNMNGNWSKLELTGTIKAHSSYLITDSKANPTFVSDISAKGDQTWADLLFYNKGMKVVLLSSTVLLQNANPFMDKMKDYVDMIGTAGNDNGSTIDGYEGDYPTGKTEGTSKQKSVRREAFTDTDNNKADFKQTSFDSLDGATLNLLRPHSSADGQWGLVVADLGISTMSLPAAKAGSDYTVSLSVYGGMKPYKFEAYGLPEGLSMDTASGRITGTPTTAGTASVSISVYDSSTVPRFAKGTYTLHVAEGMGDGKQDILSVTKIGGYSVGTSNKDGGVAEIIRYNRDNGRFYLINGSSQPATVDIVNLKDGVNPEKEHSINVETLSETDDFKYGDLTSVDINTATKKVAVAVQEEDAMKQGKVLVLNYEGELLSSYPTGIQPDMVKFTDDGRYIITADEAEPRTMDGDPEGSVTIIDTFENSVHYVKFNNPDVIDDSVHIRGPVDPDTKLITGKGEKTDAVRDLEPEFIQLSDDQKTAYISLQENNAIATIDIAAKEVRSVKGLGLKDFSDSANKLDLLSDGQIKLENVPFYGVYMPDGIDQYTVGGKTYLFTANEGDATEWDSKENVSKIGKIKASLNPTSLAALFLNGTEAYDKVEVMTDMGNDGIYLYGARSFSIWEAETMKQVYDSGSDFEQITGERLPDYFNASNSNITLDSRSPKKGPEPEYIKVGKVGQRALAFIGLERIGGLMTYDVTDPIHPVFVNYINTREFTSSNILATDTGPEGIEFIPATASPTGLPLVLVANEVGGTVAIYQFNVDKVTLNQTSLSLKAGGASTVLEAVVAPAGEGVSTVTWSSSNAGIASVDDAGKVTPIAQGTTVITAYSADGYGVAEAHVTVAAADPAAPYQPINTNPAQEIAAPATAISSQGNTITVELKPTLDAAGAMKAAVTLDMVQAMLKSLDTAERGELLFRSSTATPAREVVLSIPSAALASIAASSFQGVTFETVNGTVSLNRSVFSSLNKAANGEDLSLSIARVDSSAVLDTVASEWRVPVQSKLGARPVVDLTIHAGSRTLSSFEGAAIVVSVPYTPVPHEDANAIVAYYVTEKGELVVVPNSVYDTAAGALIFKTTHFSKYAVGYNKIDFSDSNNSFAKDSITYLAARGIIAGIGDGKFGTKMKLSRADAVLLLSHMAGADLRTEAPNSFTDVKPGVYYANAVTWAERNGIISGVGDGRFDPLTSVTREQLAVMLVRFAEVMNWTLPANLEAVGFADEQSISSYAIAAARTVQQAGILTGRPVAGRTSVSFSPQDHATREETAAMLAALLKLAD